jgi:hypothetical protein
MLERGATADPAAAKVSGKKAAGAYYSGFHAQGHQVRRITFCFLLCVLSAVFVQRLVASINCLIHITITALSTIGVGARRC